ncbi:MAG: hypothetical protein CMI18_01865 [Opitutaceae bacterium]|nr:hypothetical protein [Opitutaceae bacterium]
MEFQSATRGFQQLGLLILVSLLWIACSKPKSVQDLYPNMVIDEKIAAKQFTVLAKGSEPMIDDLEDGDLNGLMADGRNWSWMQFDDTTDGIQYLTIDQEQTAPGKGNSVLYVKGGNWKNTGAGLSAHLVGKASPKSMGVYDASQYAGLHFWVKAVGLSQLKLAMDTTDTASKDEGGICLENCPGKFESVVSVGESWQQIKIPFTQFLLTKGKHSIPLDPKNLKAIHFHLETTGDYEVWLDEVSFLTGKTQD